MAYLTEKQLADEAESYSDILNNLQNIRRIMGSPQLTIFLSHSHLDQKLVKGIISLMNTQGIEVYVDWNDSSMPRITCKETAVKIKDKIKDMRIFLILCTNNAMNSLWVPWETGVADQCKKNDEICIIPIADSSGKFRGNEYLQLYSMIGLDYAGNLKIASPNQSINEGISFGEYFRNKIL